MDGSVSEGFATAAKLPSSLEPIFQGANSTWPADAMAEFGDRTANGQRPSAAFAHSLSVSGPLFEGIDAADADLQASSHRIRASKAKRALDMFGAGLGLLFLAPLLLLIALVVRLESRGPVLFRQWRAGRGGVPFMIYKFRTMTVLENGMSIVQASREDRRLTRVGGFLRRSCIDELPQLLNVLKGEMSLIGPRPHAIAHDLHYSASIPEYKFRFLVRPGIAGLAQVSGHRGPTPTAESMAQRVKLDLEYISGWTFKSDLRILMSAITDGPFHPAAF
jgi:putative colanic acid biosynthesis UDP-glucose lipid carrier transferase